MPCWALEFDAGVRALHVNNIEGLRGESKVVTGMGRGEILTDMRGGGGWYWGLGVSKGYSWVL